MASKDRAPGIDSTSKASITDAMMVKASIQTPEPKVCALLDKLPRGTNETIEIRDDIWRLIILRPVTIFPRVRKREYLFATGSQAEGHKHSRPRRQFQRPISVTTNPTREQLKLIQSEVQEFTIDDFPEHGQQIKCAVHYRDGFGPQIINKADFQIHPFGGSVSIMRVCKKMEQECTVILYGENKYEFDVSDCHKMHQLKTPWDVPGFPLFEELPSKATISVAIEKLFDLECYQPAFIAKDLFFDGGFTLTLKTRGERNPALGFGAILPMYTLIIAEVCPKIRKLTLHQSSLAFDSRNRSVEKEKEMGYDYGMMYSIVGKVVLGLPNLQQLQLGAYYQPPIARSPSDWLVDHRYEWGKSIQWMKFVEERYVNQLYTPCTIPTNLPNNDVGQAHVPIRSVIYIRYKDSLEHECPGSYGTSTCTWTVTLCPSQTNPGSTGKLPRDGDYRKDRYGLLPEMSDDEWKCSDAHGGIRRDHGRILNISTKVDRVGAPRTWVSSQRVKKWWH
ncbi:hypothetical protein BPAE_0079g00040 [Botrytis paeoniae]|uniref:Uncharacterized protein n=1 Tax=Botrytis paeoniae TaxID=278948 RepID=A0A4Z1FPE8_9HELO|nr:hypothetical protein BPAE_0079g00040 [Botrytis paeoniae]